jgi:hypothetical protein
MTACYLNREELFGLDAVNSKVELNHNLREKK